MAHAVGIAMADAVPVNVARVDAPSRHCTLVGRARRGETVCATSDDISCPIARYVLGCDPAKKGIEAAAASFVESKLAKDPAAARRFAEGFPTLEPKRRVFVYFPLGGGPVPADVVVHFVRPEEAMQRMRALVTATGDRTDVRAAGSAAMCADCTAHPLSTGRASLSPGCPGSRREVPIAEDEILFALPRDLEHAVNVG